MRPIVPLCAVLTMLIAPASSGAAEWSLVPVPGTWDEHSDSLADYDGFAWYRCKVTVPGGWKGRAIELHVGSIDNAHEAYFNGTKVGGAGGFPPEFRNASGESKRYEVPAEAVQFGRDNVVAIRVYDDGGRGGFEGPAPVLAAGKHGIALNGNWEFRTGDDPQWADEPVALTDVAIFWRAMDLDKAVEIARPGGTLEADAAARTFSVPDDLEWELVLAEPVVRQPLFIEFDERGRMWVMQYLQYPYPAGLQMVSKDEYWRAVYDKVPEPPPHGVRGADRITIHEDTDGDGTFDAHKTFVDGLNIATSFAKGRGGVWVLNPPYLLFYPDRDNNDVPDGDPEVHLAGFGMEDTHSVVNSLRWGPDGWLYAAQGSTVSGNVRRPELDKQGVFSQGQLIWRYHPETRRYEIFAEGGGNAFGVEIDDKGRIYSGHNGGNTRGFHYVQGGYYQKGFSKHGPLSNPYSFGYFPWMQHHDVERFTHNFVLYEAAALPERYRGHLFGIEPLQGRIVEAEITPDTSTFRTKDLGRPVTTSDANFRPVDIKVGPDGAIYVADFYEPQISHREHFSGQIDKETGRIYRLTAKSREGDAPAEPQKPTDDRARVAARQEPRPPDTPFDLSSKSSRELVDLLRHENKWYRQTALRLLGDRKDASVIPYLEEGMASGEGQFALECLWGIYQSGGFNDDLALRLLGHEDEFVREWTVRLIGDERQAASAIAGKLAEMAASEPSVYVRSQLASTAKRLPAGEALPIVRNLLGRSDDLEDVHIPLLIWWALESKGGSHPEAVLALFSDRAVWDLPLVRKHILHRLMQRYAMAGTRNDLLLCAKLLELSPSDETNELLMRGFEDAFKGRSLAGLPTELMEALAKAGGGSLVLGIRRGDGEAVEKALALIADEKADRQQRLDCIQAFGEVDQPRSVPVLLAVLKSSADDPLRMAALTALQCYPDETIGTEVLALYPELSKDVLAAAQTLLASRANWSRQLLAAVDAGRIDPKSLPVDLVRTMTFHSDERIAALVRKHWSNLEGSSTAEMQQQMARASAALHGGSADPYSGKKLYMESCGKCHILFGEGGRIGPELTTYNRRDLPNLLANVVNPSAEVREGFESYLVLTDDGRTASGFLFDQDNRVIVLRGVDGQNITIPRERIEEMLPQKKSLMPEGLLGDLSEQQIRDLFAYLQSSQPIRQ